MNDPERVDEGNEPPAGDDWPEQVEHVEKAPPKPIDEKFGEYMDKALELLKPGRNPLEPPPIAPEMEQMLKRMHGGGERRVKFIGAVSFEKLETAVNDFLTSGIDIAAIGDRIHRYGNELVKEVHYFEPMPVMTAAEVEKIMDAAEEAAAAMGDAMWATAS